MVDFRLQFVFIGDGGLSQFVFIGDGGLSQFVFIGDGDLSQFFLLVMGVFYNFLKDADKLHHIMLYR